MRLNREEDFLAGLEILRPFFEERDFELRKFEPYPDKEGVTYSAQFVWGNHTVTLTHMFSLGPVTYSVGRMSIEHTAYLDALGVRKDASFPAFADDSISGYSALLQDLETRLTPFFEEPDREFMELAAKHGSQGRPRPPRA
jgi:hypothetical protein